MPKQGAPRARAVSGGLRKSPRPRQRQARNWRPETVGQRNESMNGPSGPRGRRSSRGTRPRGQKRTRYAASEAAGAGRRGKWGPAPPQPNAARKGAGASRVEGRRSRTPSPTQGARKEGRNAGLRRRSGPRLGGPVTYRSRCQTVHVGSGRRSPPTAGHARPASQLQRLCR